MVIDIKYITFFINITYEEISTCFSATEVNATESKAFLYISLHIEELRQQGLNEAIRV